MYVCLCVCVPVSVCADAHEVTCVHECGLGTCAWCIRRIATYASMSHSHIRIVYAYVHTNTPGRRRSLWRVPQVMASSFKRPSSSSFLISAQVRDSFLFVIYASSMPNRHRERQRGGGEGSVGVREAGREGRRERERESSEITTAQVGYCLLHWPWTIRFVRVFCNGLRQQR